MPNPETRYYPTEAGERAVRHLQQARDAFLTAPAETCSEWVERVIFPLVRPLSPARQEIIYRALIHMAQAFIALGELDKQEGEKRP